MFAAIVGFIMKRTNWSIEMDFALHGRQLKVRINVDNNSLVKKTFSKLNFSKSNGYI